ncbi:MAG: amidase family protein [Hyphomicrobiales bacterium]|nr:amidase family protein [Hyphomicrobiales bacterium]
MNGEIWRWDTLALARSIRTRAISSREAVESCLERLDSVNPRINAVVDVLADEALNRADEADVSVKRGDELPALHGVPVTVKINVDFEGRANTNGVVAFKDAITPSDAPAVSNWRKAGAIFIGRTNTPAFSWRWFTDNDLHGRTFNPWNRNVTPGGSSGGAAAAVAAGIGPLAHGSDIGGSIRYPAYACGIAGIRPTLGRVPAFNPSSKEERPVIAQLASVQGPLARSVGDLRVGLRTMATRDVRDPWWVPAPHEQGNEHLPCRVAMLAQLPGVAHDQEVADAVRLAAAWLEDSGYRVEEVTPPHWQEAAELWALLVLNETRYAMLPSIEALGDEAIKRAVRAMMEITPTIDFEGFRAGMARRSSLLRDWMLFLEKYPLVLTPTSWRKPFPVGADQKGVEGMRKIFEAQSPLFVLPLLGLPGLSVPTGTADGLPTGVHLIGGRYEEERLFVAGEVIEARCGRLTPIDPRD